MKLICINSPVKGLIKEGQVYPSKPGAAQETVIISDEFGMPFYVKPVPGSVSLYSAKLAGSRFIFQKVEANIEYQVKKQVALRALGNLVGTAVLVSIVAALALVLPW